MEDLYLDRLIERSGTDKASMAEAMDELKSTVMRGRKAGETCPPMTRRLPDRKLTLRDLASFAFHSVSAADIVYIIAISIAVALLGMLAPLLNKQIFDGIIPSGEVGNLVPVAFVLASAGIGSLMFGVTRDLLLMRVRDKINVDTQAAVLDRTFRMPANFFKEFAAGNAGSRVMAVSEICVTLSDTVLSGILSMLFSLIYFYQVFIYAKSLVGVCVLILLANLALSATGFFCYLKFNRTIRQADVELNGFLFSLVCGIQKIKTSGSERRAFAKWAGLFAKASPDKADRPLLLSLMPALSILVSLGGTMLIFNGAYTSGMALSDYIAFNVAFGMISGAAASFNRILPSLATLRPLVELVRPILDTEPEKEEEGGKVTHLSGSIEINDLKFRYSDDSPYIYDGLNLKINPGEFVALVGPSGCGKSTLMRLLLGFEKPESGTIFYDQYNLATVDKPSLRRKIGSCMQEKRLFGGTIFENITVTNPSATMNDAWQAAAIAGVADDIKEMPMQMRTLLNDTGSGLSGGQKQRILIARAIIGKPAILFMDEATSALDNLRQDQVVNNLGKINCTRLFIAHRLSTVVSCDRILVLDGGRIVEEGDYATLMAKKGFFYELVKRQQ